MAASPTPDPTEVRRRGRQRLIGAIALVLLAVVFVPMILDPEPAPDRGAESRAARNAVTLPPKEGAPALPAPLPATATPPAEAPAAAPGASRTEPEKPKSVPAKTAELKSAPARTAEPKAAPAKAEEPQAAPAKVEEPKSASAPRLEGFAVQVGAFRDEEKLQQAREKLKAARIAHFVERRAAGELTRLRAGPYPTREAAEKGRAQVKAAGFDGQVVTLP